MSLMNTIVVTTTVFGRAFATQPSYGVGMRTTTYRGSAPVTLWIPVLGNFVAVLVIPFVGNLSDKVGRKPVFIVGALSSGATSFLYLYSIGQGNVIMTVVMAIIMWGILTRAATRSSPRSTWNCSRPGRVSPRSPSPRTSVRR